MPPEMMPDDEPEAPDAGEPADDEYTHAFRVLRHAITDGDDEAGAKALHDFIDLCESDEGEEGEPEKKKPDLAILLAGGTPRGKKEY